MVRCFKMPQKNAKYFKCQLWFFEAIESKNKKQNLLQDAFLSLLMGIGYCRIMKKASILIEYFTNFQ